MPVDFAFESGGLLLEALVIMAVRWELNRQARVDPADGRVVLLYGWFPLLGTLIGFTLFAGLVLMGLSCFGVGNAFGLLNLVVCGLLSLLCGYGLVELMIYRLTLDARGLTWRTTRRLSCELGWDEVREVGYSSFLDCFVVRGALGEAIRVPRITVGIGSFVAGCRQHLAPGTYEKARGQFARIQEPA